jgi:DUF1680 family protein
LPGPGWRRRLQPRWITGGPEAREDGEHFERDADIALETPTAVIDLAEAPLMS